MSRDLPVTRFTTTAQGLVPAPGAAKGGFLRDDGTWQIPAGGVTVPLVLNSVAGQVTLTVNGASGQEGAIFNGGANGDAAEFLGSSTSGQSFGVFIGAGTTSGDYALKVQPKAGGINYLLVRGDGSGTLGPSATLGLNWGTSGNIVIPAPVSGGIALSVNGNGAQIGVFNGTAANSYFDYQRLSALVGRIGSGDSILVGGGIADFAITAPNGNLVLGAVGSTHIATISNAGTFALDITTPNGGPWALQLTRADLGTSIHVFNNNNQWFFDAPVNCQGGLLVAGAAVSFPTTGSFTATYVGGTTAPTVTVTWTKTGNTVTFSIPNIAATSNATTFSLSGIPSGLFSTSAAKLAGMQYFAENNTVQGNLMAVSTSTAGSFLFTLSGSTTIGGGWTAAGTKGFTVPICVTVDVS